MASANKKQLSTRVRRALARGLKCGADEITPELVAKLKWHQINVEGIGIGAKREITQWMAAAGYRYSRNHVGWRPLSDWYQAE